MRSLLKDRLRKAFEAQLDQIVDAVLSKCLECGADTAHMHHLVPRVHGGQVMVPVCNKCHGYIHDLDFTNHSELTKAGMRKAAEEGRFKFVDDSMLRAIAKRLDEGWTYRKIIEKHRVGKATIAKARRLYCSS
jgi:hypothetical protein